jgi:hypothetical protein
MTLVCWSRWDGEAGGRALVAATRVLPEVCVLQTVCAAAAG